MKDSNDTNSFAGKTATTDKYLLAVTAGERKPLNSTVKLEPCDPDWPSQFSVQATRIRDALSEKVLLLKHVGSTSVPGLSSKPTIDMVLAEVQWPVISTHTRFYRFYCLWKNCPIYWVDNSLLGRITVKPAIFDQGSCPASTP